MHGPCWSSYDSIAEAYDAVSAPHYFERPADRLVHFLAVTTGDRVLDAGAGTGLASVCALRRTPRVVAADPSLPMLRRARGRGVVSAVGCRLPELPFADGAFDRVVAAFVLNHSADPGKATLDLARVLASGGRLGLATWAKSPSEHEAGEIWNQTAWEFVARETLEEQVGRALPAEAVLADPERLRDLLESAGLAVERISQLEFPVSIPAEVYLASRSLAMTARFLKDALPAGRWRLFERSVEHKVLTRLGRRLEFTVAVNFAVGSKRP